MPDEVMEKTAENGVPDRMDFLLERYKTYFPTDGVVIVAKENALFAKSMIRLLLARRKEITITANVLLAACDEAALLPILLNHRNVIQLTEQKVAKRI